MKRILPILMILIYFSACSEKKNTNLTISGNIQGLREGTLFLQKIENDTSIVNLDSLEVDGDAHFEFYTFIAEPKVLFLYLDKKDGDKNDDIIPFFAEKGEMSIQTQLENFYKDAVIKGSKNQKKLEEYQEIIKKFNDRNAILVQKTMDAHRENDPQLLENIQKNYQQLVKSKYLYTVNYALNHKDMEIAPYLAISEIYDAKTVFLDTIYNSLTQRIQKSYYGVLLKELLEERKKEEH